MPNVLSFISSGLFIIMLTSAHAESSRVIHAWEFDDKTFALAYTSGMEVQVENGLLKGVVQEVPAVYMVFPPTELTAPVKVRIRARTDADISERGEIYWVTRESPGWDMQKLVRFSLVHDQAWHEYEIVLPAVGVVTGFRLALGERPGTFEIDWIRFESAPYPEFVEKACRALPEALVIENDALAVALHARLHVYEVRDKRTGALWTGSGSTGNALLTSAEVTTENTLALTFWDHHGGATYRGTVELLSPATLAFTLDSDDYTQPFYALNAYPPALHRNDLAAGKMLFCDRSSGVYIDLNDPVYGGRMLMVYGNTSCTDMPWVGIVDEEQGDGYMALAETPHDAFFHLARQSEAGHFPQIIWRESMDAFRYSRRFSYRFVPSGGYVALARCYREYARDSGLLLTLEEKARRKPAVTLLKGAPIMWGSSDAWQFVREARAEGILQGVIANASHGLEDVNSLVMLQEMGYLTLDYDNVSDIVDGPTGFGRDNVERVALHARPGLGPKSGWQGEVSSYFVRSSAFALEALKKYVPGSLEKYGFNGRFIDVDMAIELHEDHHPEHTFDRRQDMVNRRGIFEWLGSLGLVLGTEHGNDWGIDLVEYTEGGMSGPFWWEASAGWNAGRLQRTENPDDYPQNYLEYGVRYDRRIPLWQLVYHDCALTSAYWGDTPGFHYRARPDISDRLDLFNILYGGTPIFWRDGTDYCWHKDRARLMRGIHDALPVTHAVAFDALLSHEFLSADKAVQRTRFSSGHAVVVNFSDTPRDYDTGSGDVVMIAPSGFYVSGPAVHQSRLLEEDDIVLRASAPGYCRFESPSFRDFGPVAGSGTLVAFQVHESRWQFVVESGGTCTVDPEALTSWKSSEVSAFVALDKNGDPVQVLTSGTVTEPADILPGKGRRYYALVKDMNLEEVLIYPVDPWLASDANITLSSAMPGAAIHYTLDGTEPDAGSPRYFGAFRLTRSGSVRARLFHDGQPVGSETTREFRVFETLYAGDVMRGGDPVQMLDFDVSAFDALRIRVTGADDQYRWADWANMVDARFLLDDGGIKYLSDMPPAHAKQTYHELGQDRLGDAAKSPLMINGVVYEKGISTFSNAEVIYPIPPRAHRFIAGIGVDDRGNPPGGKPLALRGSVRFYVDGVVPVQSELP